ncbi:Nucleoside transmembrane transporter [Blomia tropicalis]|nr:Nucleoside transmembrane transporter [Blomia tropicalis]
MKTKTTKTITTEDDYVPNDRWNLVSITFIFHGIALLMPWEIYITAYGYFTNHKLVPNIDENDSNVNEQFKYQEYFLAAVTLIANIPNFLFQLMNLFISDDNAIGSYSQRVLFSIIGESVLMLSTLIMVFIDTSRHIGPFFYFTMITILILNVFNGIYTSTIYGLASKLPTGYSNFVVIGANSCGTLISLWNICSLYLNQTNSSVISDYENYAVIYFLSAFIILIIALATFIGLRFNNFYRYYMKESVIEPELAKVQPINELIESNECVGLSQYMIPLRLMCHQYLNVFMVFFVTLIVFPVLQVNIKTIDPHFLFNDQYVTQTYFNAIFCFFTFNFSALMGNLAAGYGYRIPPNRISFFIFARILFIPFFVSCNLYPEFRSNVWPVLIQSDMVYIIGAFLFAFTSGYFSSLAVIYARENIPGPDPAIQGKFVSVFLYGGILAGAFVSGQMVRFFVH